MTNKEKTLLEAKAKVLKALAHPTRLWMAEQLSTFDRLGLGKFGDLLTAVVKGPAMIRWLDNESNAKGQANENFARELLELFTLGRDQYSEKDIKEAARAFTGWRIRKNEFFFDRSRHDTGEKSFLGTTGRLDGDKICQLALEQSSWPGSVLGHG